MDTREIKLIISNSPPFNKLKERQLNNLIDLCTVKEYKNDEVIYRQGDPPDYLYLLLKGRVMALAEVDLKDSPIEILKRGTCFGIISLLTDDPHSVTTRSIETSFILQIPKDKIKEFFKKTPSLSLDFSRILSQRVKARLKPKQIFQSRRIAISGDAGSGKSTYMLDLALKLKEQTAKNIICLQIVSKDDEMINFIDGRAPIADNKDKILLLKDFSEEDSSYIRKDKIDCLYIRLEEKSNFASLLNYLSESYHFILYDLGRLSLKSNLYRLAKPAHQLHFIVFPRVGSLKKWDILIKELKEKKLFNQEDIKVILAQWKKEPGLTFLIKRKLINHPIYATIPAYESADYPKALRRIARQIGEVVLGMALGSGAAYGFCHIGILGVLQENNIMIDIICGSSMGSIIAALWAAGFDIRDIERLSSEAGKKINSFSIRGVSFPFRGVMKARHLENIFKNIFGDLTFYDLKHTLKIVAFDFLKRKTVILEEGPLYKAVAASCAFPGIFEPVKFKKDILLDGGILNPLPTKILLNYDTHKIIASNITLSRQEALKTYGRRGKLHIFDFIFGSVETMQQQFVAQALKIADVVIHPNLEGLGWMEFEKVDEFRRRGERATKEKLQEIKRLVES